jgi:hypothetical protein
MKIDFIVVPPLEKGKGGFCQIATPCELCSIFTGIFSLLVVRSEFSNPKAICRQTQRFVSSHRYREIVCFRVTILLLIYTYFSIVACHFFGNELVRSLTMAYIYRPDSDFPLFMLVVASAVK